MPATDPDDIIATAPVFDRMARRELTGTQGDYIDAAHRPAFASKSATFALSFSLDRLPGDYALISKDGSGSGAGDFTVWLKDGTIVVSQEDGRGGTEWLKVPGVVLEAHQTYHFALSAGQDGLMVWINGRLAAAEPEFMQGLEGNSHPLVIGGTRAWRDSSASEAHSLFKGTIGGVMVFDRQLGADDMLALAAAADPALAMPAGMAAEMAALAPVFEQLHNASGTLQDILAGYGFGDGDAEAGPMGMSGMGMDAAGMATPALAMVTKGRAANDLAGTRAADGLNGGGGDDKIAGRGGDDVLQGGYGNDRLSGGRGNDILDGGHGEDRLSGGAGRDLLIARADGREGAIFYDPDRDEGDPLGELTNGKLYPGQPVPADDVLTGGKGADIFYFQTLINAKERYIRKHTNDDGTINWHGVAGENDSLHDHWVDVLGNDVVTDYSRAEGDRLVIEGHTTQILSIGYGDANGDGVLDHSVIRLYSDQGKNGGAHNDDRLGTIKVYGDLVKRSDIEHSAAPAYGIVAGIGDLAEALAPSAPVSEGGRIKTPKALPDGEDLKLASGLAPVLAIPGGHRFSPEERAPLIAGLTEKSALKAGTIAFSFIAAETGRFQALFSKDASGEGEGHMAAYVSETGSLAVRIQEPGETRYMTVDHMIDAGKTYDFALSFGPRGAELYLNNVRVAYDSSIRTGLADNREAFVVGASGWNSTPGSTDDVDRHFDGTIAGFSVFGRQLTGSDIFGPGMPMDTEVFTGSVNTYGFARSEGELTVTARGAPDTVIGDATEFLKFGNMTVRVSEVQFGSHLNDVMTGRDGADIMLGGRGDDNMRGYGNDDLLRGAGGNDSLYGGKGADRLLGEAGDDKLLGGDGQDLLSGGAGNDTLYGEAGSDRFYGGLGDDRIFGHTWNESGGAGNDRVYFDGNFKDFRFETATWDDSGRGMVRQLTVTDRADGGADGYYEGSDRLIDVDWLVFADRTVAFEDLL